MSEEKELYNKKFGSEGALDVAWLGDQMKLRLMLGYDGKGADVGLYVDVEFEYLIDKLAAAIPGEIDDAVLALVKSAAKSA